MSNCCADSSIETDFSGTTYTAAVIRNNKCTLCNIGDSRTSLGYRSKTGVTAVALTIDHKPDMPAEKVRAVFVASMSERSIYFCTYTVYFVAFVISLYALT